MAGREFMCISETRDSGSRYHEALPTAPGGHGYLIIPQGVSSIKYYDHVTDHIIEGLRTLPEGARLHIGDALYRFAPEYPIIMGNFHSHLMGRFEVYIDETRARPGSCIQPGFTIRLTDDSDNDAAAQPLREARGGSHTEGAASKSRPPTPPIPVRSGRRPSEGTPPPAKAEGRPKRKAHTPRPASRDESPPGTTRALRAPLKYPFLAG